MAQINGGPQLLPGNVKLRVLVPVPGNPSGLSPAHTSSPSSSARPNGQRRGRGVQLGSPLPSPASPSPREGTQCPPCGCSSPARGGQLCPNPLQTPICIFSFSPPPLFWLRNQPCPHYPSQKPDVPRGHSIPICATGTPPSTPVPCRPLLCCHFQPVTVTGRLPIPLSGDTVPPRPLFVASGTVFPWLGEGRGGRHSQSPVMSTRDGTGLAPSPRTAVWGLLTRWLVGRSECSKV